MTRRALRTLIVIVVGLAAVLFFLETDDRQDNVPGDGLLFPDFKAAINEVTAITVVRADAEAPLLISRADGEWRVAARDGYPADVGRIREVLLAVADARVVEEKTADPARYGQLGVQGPAAEGAESTELSIATPARDYVLIVGKPAQRTYRYVRVADSPRSLLIDRNPDIPDSAGDWLRPELIDIDTTRVRSVRIEHGDGESISIGKASQELTDYTVENIPAGRELSYATVANGMAGALKDLALDDVRKAVDAEPVATTVFETFDGLVITVTLFAEDDTTWLGFRAAAVAVEAGDSDAAESAEDVAAAPADTPDVEAEAAAINARLAGWQYELPDYKKNLLMRRWDDILKSE